MKKKLERLSEIRTSINELYKEKSRLEDEIITHVIDNKLDKENIMLDDKMRMALVWVVDKRIDYDKLQKDYPDVYELGIVPTFSATQALNGIDRDLFNKILRDCTTVRPHYKAKYKSTKKTRKGGINNAG